MVNNIKEKIKDGVIAKKMNSIARHETRMKDINFSLISNNRQLLMGIAILGVLIGHWFN